MEKPERCYFGQSFFFGSNIYFSEIIFVILQKLIIQTTNEMNQLKIVLCGFFLSVASIPVSAKKAVVIITAGQSNTDGRVMNAELPDYIQQNRYHYCQWSFGSGAVSGNGVFEKFWPRIAGSDHPDRWAYDAVVYYRMEQQLHRPFYVIKESLGGTAIDPRCPSRNSMYWSADSSFLASNAASDQGGKSLLKALTGNIGMCIDRYLADLKEGYDIKLMMWHQGESDRQQAADYYDNLKKMISYVRHYLVMKTGKRRYARLPVILGGISHHSKQYNEVIEQAKIRLAQEDRHIYFVPVPEASLGRDEIHFDAKGAEFLGTEIYRLIEKEKLLK